MSIDEIRQLRRQLMEWKEYPLASDAIDAIDSLHSVASNLLLALACVSTAAVAMFIVILLWVMSKVI